MDWGAYILCYLVGPLLGAIGAAFLYGYVGRLPRVKQEATGSDLPVIAGARPGATA